MELGAFLDPRALPLLIAVALMLVLAGLLLVIRFNDRVNRAFAIFLVVRGFAMALGALGAVDADPAQQQYWSTVGGYFHLASFLALLGFLWVYPKGWRIARRMWARAALLLATLALVLAYAANKCIWICPETPGSAVSIMGPAAAVPLVLVLAVAGLYLLREHLKAAPGPRRQALLLVGGVFALNGLFDGARSLGSLKAVFDLGLVGLNFVPTPWAWMLFVGSALALVPSLMAVVILARAWRAEGLFATQGRRWSFGAALLALVSGLAVGLDSAGVLRNSVWGIVVLGFWRISIPVVVSYAILRHELFDLDLKVKWTLKRSGVVAVLGAAFFVGSQLLEKLIPVDSLILGIASAAIIALALRPIERAAGRMVDGLLPDVKEKNTEYLADRKLEVYRAAVESAVEDGEITEKERSVLERLRGKLGIDPAHASSVETSLGLAPWRSAAGASV